MNKEYKIKLDLNKKLYNKKMTFNQFDENVNDFYIEVTKNNEVVKDLDKSIITLVAIKPNNTVEAQFVEVENGLVYADLKPSMCDLVGNYQAKAMIVLEGEIVTTDTINYSVSEDKIISRLNDDIVSDERFTLFTDALARLSNIEISEEQRVTNEAERILSEENRKIEEAKRVEAELIRQHEEADRAKYDATRESNENIRKQNESIRLANETNRIDEEAKRVEEENKRKLAEEERNANYNFMTEDEERRRLEANAHKEAEVLRVQAETNRVNEEAKRRTTEQVRVSAENTRVSNENTREANEEARQSNETKRVEAETQRQSRYNSFITDAEANANNFENYTNNAKVKEEERKSNELDRKSQEDRRVSNEVERISNENTRKANEVAREKNETSRQNIFENKVDEVDEKIIEINTTKDNFVSSINTKVDNKISEIDSAKSDMTNTVSNKVNEVETRFNALTSSQQQSSEVIDARDGETSLKARLDRDIKETNKELDKIKKLEESTVSIVTTESDFTTVEATSNGYFEDVKLEGKTLVNLIPTSLSFSTYNNMAFTSEMLTNLNPASIYTLIVIDNNLNKLLDKAYLSDTTGVVNSLISLHKCAEGGTGHPHVYTKDGSLIPDGYMDNVKAILLEGDHTQNPPSYFEGLKSVGQSASEDGADEIVVSSVKGDGNLIDLNNAHSKYCTISSDSIVGTNEYNDVQFYVYLEKGAEYFFNSDGSHDITADIMCGMQKKHNASAVLQSLNNLKTKPFTFIGDTGLYTLHVPKFRGIVKDIQLVKSTTPKPYTPHQADKKRLLYYNNETQTWEKPILREWDSIEKHADGKYYYHQRSGEVVLNGSENWSTVGTDDTKLSRQFILGDYPSDIAETKDQTTPQLISDTIPATSSDAISTGTLVNEVFGIAVRIKGNKGVFIALPKTKLSTQDVAGFKQWLQANNVTVVYQLAEEKVYECTNIDLITYANETNYIVESGAIVPRTTLKVHNNISNVVSLLQKKVSLLESNIKASQEVQDMMILETDMRMLDIELALMEFIPMKLNLGGSDMLRSATYFNFLKNHIINETYEKEYLENVMNKYLATGRINQDEYNELYKILYPPVYDIELPIEY